MPDTYVTVEIALGRVEGDYIKALLNAEGVGCELLQEAIGHVYGLSVGPLAEVQIRVPSRQAKRARALLRRYRASKRRASRSARLRP